MMTKRNFYVIIEMENFDKDRGLGFMITRGKNWKKKLMTAVDVEKMNWKYYQEILEVNTRKITDVRKNLEFHDYRRN